MGAPPKEKNPISKPSLIKASTGTLVRILRAQAQAPSAARYISCRSAPKNPKPSHPIAAGLPLELAASFVHACPELEWWRSRRALAHGNVYRLAALTAALLMESGVHLPCHRSDSTTSS